MEFQLRFQDPESNAVLTVDLPLGKTVTFGASADNDVVIPNACLEARHFAIQNSVQGCKIKPLSPGAQVQVDGLTVPLARLDDSSIITAGDGCFECLRKIEPPTTPVAGQGVGVRRLEGRRLPDLSHLRLSYFRLTFPCDSTNDLGPLDHPAGESILPWMNQTASETHCPRLDHWNPKESLLPNQMGILSSKSLNQLLGRFQRMVRGQRNVHRAVIEFQMWLDLTTTGLIHWIQNLESAWQQEILADLPLMVLTSDEELQWLGNPDLLRKLDEPAVIEADAPISSILH